MAFQFQQKQQNMGSFPSIDQFTMSVGKTASLATWHAKNAMTREQDNGIFCLNNLYHVITVLWPYKLWGSCLYLAQGLKSSDSPEISGKKYVLSKLT